MTKHKERAEEREENKKPVNFTCGVCHKVHPYNEGYECTEARETGTIDEVK